MAGGNGKPSAETRIAQAMGTIDAETGAVVPPVYPSSTYARRSEDYARIGKAGYSRDDNPTYELPERMIAELHGGAACRLFSSGMAALAALFQGLRPGQHVICSEVMYFGTPKWLDELVQPWGLAITYVDSSDVDAVRSAVQPGRTAMILIETPGNPTWTVSDIAAIAGVAGEAGAPLVVDNTGASPVCQQPLAHGADLVIESCSKFLNGHSDVVAGAVVARDDSHPLFHAVRRQRYLAGPVLGPMEAWLLTRGMRTLFVRVRAQQATAERVARHFDGHPKIAEVRWPGLASFPGHAVAKRQMTGGYGSMLALRIAGGEDAALAVAKACRVFIRATSLGGVESLIEHRATIEGEACTCPRDLLRVSIGLESREDLIADLEQALAQV